MEEIVKRREGAPTIVFDPTEDAAGAERRDTGLVSLGELPRLVWILPEVEQSRKRPTPPRKAKGERCRYRESGDDALLMGRVRHAGEAPIEDRRRH